MRCRRVVFLLLGALLVLGQAGVPVTLSPNSGQPGTTVDVVVNGPPLTPNGGISFDPPGFLVPSNPRSDGTHLIFTLQISPRAAAGSYAFVYEAPSLAARNQLRVPNAFTVTPAVATPIVRSITPSQFTAGDPPSAVTITGINFAPGATVKFSGSGVIAQVMNVTSSAISAQVVAAESAAAGSRDVIVTNPDGTSNAKQSPPVQISVIAARPKPAAAAVAVRSITPNQITAGDPPAAVTITGIGFTQGASVTFSGSGLIATVRSITQSSIMADVGAGASAAAGPRDVIVTNPDGTSNAKQLPAVQLTVRAARPAPPAAPTVAVRSVTPSQVTAGAPSIDVTIAGTGFAPGASVSFSGSGVAAVTKSVTPSSILAQVTADASAATTARSVVVTNADGSSNAKQSPPVLLTVLPPAPPQPRPLVVRSIEPNQIVAGAPPIHVTIRGEGFGNAETVKFSGTGVIGKLITRTATVIEAEATAIASASPGPRNVIVTRNDGTSNAAQLPPVTLTVVPAPVVPVPTTPPPVVPPTTTPPTTTPPTTTPPTTTPPTTAPPVTPPVVPPPVTPVPPTIPNVPPPVKTPAPPTIPVVPPVKPPTELLIGPRIDKITPEKLEPGKKYKIDIAGKNLSVDTKISLGGDVTIVGAPLIKSPTSAVADVLVSPAAKPGVVAARATSPKGSNLGPGGVLISTASRQKPKIANPPTVVAKKHFKQPTGDIVLDAPCDPDLRLSSECEEPVTLNDATTFVWHELNPGIAKFFVFEIVDADQKVLFSAQTPKKYYRMSAANLASLPRIETAPRTASTANFSAAVDANPNPGAVSAAASHAGPGQKSKVNFATEKPLKKGDSAAMTQAMKTSGPGGIKLGVDRMVFAGRRPVAGEVYWRVRGMSSKIDELTGMKLSEVVQSEDSPERAIVLPLPPNGFSCDLGTNSKIGALVPLFKPSIFGYLKRPKPCPGESLNICADADFAELASSARLDLRRLPFALQQIGDFASSSEVTFQNVFIDWGDGSEPEPLKVKGVLKSGKQTLSAVRFISPGDDENVRVKHRYHNENEDAEFVTYKIRIFAVADPDETHPAQVSEVTKAESKPMGSLTALGFGAQSDAASASAAKPSAGATATASASAAPNTSAVASLTSRLFTIACTEVKVWNPWGVGADEPLHLLTADVMFPTDGDKTKSPIKDKDKGKTSVKDSMPIPSDASFSASTKGATAVKSGVGAPTGKSGTTGATASASPAPPKAGSVAAADVPVTGTTPVPTISDCSTAFKASVRLTYWGHGKVKLLWYLDGVLLETTEVPSELPPVSTANGEAGKKPYVVNMMSALPPVLQAQLHKLTVHAEVVKMKPFVIKPGGGYTVPSDKVVKLGGTQQSYAHVNQTYSASTPSKKKSMGATSLAAGPETSTTAVPFVVFAAPPAEPGSQVDSPIRYYRVVDHKTLGFPCALRYLTAQTGTFQITDLSSFSQTGDKANGSGMLNMYFPSYTGEAGIQSVKVSFTGWTLAASSTGDEDVLDVKTGSLDQSVGTDPAIVALNFPLTLKKISLTPDRLALDGDVRVQSGMGFTNETAEDLPRWEFASTPLTSDGDFRFTKSKAVDTELAASQFELKISNAEIDFSRKEGSGPAQSCTATPTDASWQGIRIDGVMSAPGTLQFNNVKLLKDYPFTGWGIGSDGLSVKFDDAAFSKQVSTSGVGIKATGFSFSVCGGSFGSPTFGVEVSNAPLVVQTIKGKITLDAFAVPHSSFAGISVDHDWGNVKGHISHASLGNSATLGTFAITINSHFWFKVRGKPAYDADYDGILITLDGNVYSSTGEHYYAVPDAGTANIAGYPMQVTQLGVGNKPNGDIWFGFMGDIEVGEHAPNAEDREAQFALTKKAAALNASEPIQLASMGDLAYFYSPDPQGFDYSTSEEGGVTVNKVHLDFAYPPSSKTVTIVADCEWQELENGFYFVGTGKVTVADSFGIDIEALYGRDVDASYWMVKASVDLPTMMALGSTGFGLKAIHGGLGCSVPISAYDLPDIKMVKTDHSGAYSFSAGVDVGTMDAFTIYCRGRLTVKMGGSDAGARLSLAAWLATSTHELPAMGEACMQYAGGAFDAGATVHLSLASGLVVIDAPKSGPDVCTQAAVSIHFGGSEDWHVWIGQETLPLTAKVLIIDGQGYLMIDGAGTKMYNAATIDKKWDVSIAGFSAYVKINGGTAITVTIVYDPFFVKGDYKGWVTIKAGADIVGGCCSISFGANLGFSAEGPPIKVCGHVGVSFSTPWPLPDVNATVGPLCIGG